MTDGAIETVMERTRQEDIRLVRFLYADHGGIIRGKAAGTARLRERMSSMDMAIIATVCPMPLDIRSRSRAVPAAFPRMIPPWSA